MEVFANLDINTIIPWLIEFFSVAFLILFLLTTTVTVIVEVFKGMLPKLPTNILAFGVSIAITGLAMAVVISVFQIPFAWYYAAGALVMGLFVAHAAMFGFDKFKDTFEKLKSMKKP